MKILIVEDEASIAEVVSAYAKRDGYDTVIAPDGMKALEIFEHEDISLVILDLMLPKLSGEEVCRRIREKSSVPIIMLTAKSGESDVVYGLDTGANDYIAKPFGVDELLARVRAALRRASARPGPSVAPSVPFPFGPFTVDPARYALRAPSSPDIPLTDRELGLLRLFAARPGEVLTRDALLNALWGVHYAGTTRTLDQHIAQLRRKLGPAASLLSTVHGLGYRYTPAP